MTIDGMVAFHLLRQSCAKNRSEEVCQGCVTSYITGTESCPDSGRSSMRAVGKQFRFQGRIEKTIAMIE